MVSLASVKASNAAISTSLPAGLVAVFVGGTSGIGAYTLKELARQAKQPRIYNIGRSREAAERIEAECRLLNPEAQYTFIQSDVSLIRNVDIVCEEIKSKEKSINILFLSQGTLAYGTKTEEGLHLAAALKFHSRARFIANLLSLLSAATSLRRVVSVLCGSKEGPIDLSDIQGWDTKGKGFIKQRGHSSSVVTLLNAHFAQLAPTVSFIHDYPGVVKSGINRGTTGMIRVFFVLLWFLGPWLYIPEMESGERHLFLATSGMYPPREGKQVGLKVKDDNEIARGIDGKQGSGVYSINEVNESASPAVEQLVKQFKEDGLVEKIWDITKDDFERIAKSPNI